MARLQAGLSWRLAWRHFRKSPGSTLYGAVTLALGLGSATLLFSMLQAFTQPLPVPGGSDVLRVVVADPIRHHDHVTVDDFRAWRTHAQSFESIAAVAVATRAVAAKLGDFSAREGVAYATAAMLPLLGVEPLLGRWPGEHDDATVAISERVWEATFYRDPEVLGRTLRMGHEVVTVVGVMPSTFRFPYKQTIWQVVPADSPRLVHGEVVVRLKPDVSRAAAGEEFTELLQTARSDRDGVQATATAPRRASARLVGFTEERSDGQEQLLFGAMLLVVLGLVLLSCSNVSALLLERNTVRSRTLALHQALGARPAQVALQTLVEALLVGALGAILGAAVAHAGLRFLTNRLADNLNFYWTRFELDLASGAFAAVLGFAVALACGALPAWRASGCQVADLLAEDARGVRSVQRTTVSWTLINVQTAFAVGVVVAALGMATVMVDRPWMIEMVDAFSGDQVAAATISFEADTADPATRIANIATLERLAHEVGALPGVRSAAVSEGDWLASYPILRSGWRRVAFGDRPFGDDPAVPILHVTPGFRDTFGISLVEGRWFNASDMSPGQSQEGTAVVTERFARERFGDQAALGRRLRLGLGGRERQHRIVGIVSNLAVTEGHRLRPMPHVLLPIAATEAHAFQLTVRTDGLAGIGARILEVTREAVPGVAVMAFSFDDHARRLNDYLGAIPETLGLLAMLGGAGCVLVVAIGIYGLVAFEMRQRLGEYAIRRALGAQTRRLLGMVVRRVCLLVAPGVLVGLVFGYAGAPLLRLFASAQVEIVPLLATVAVLYAAVVTTAAFWPAFRVVRTNPARVLNG